MHNMGIPVTVVIDDFIPMVEWADQPKFGKPDAGKGLWPIILEKAISKYYGSYSTIVGGEPSKAVSAFTGAPGRYTSISQLSADSIWKRISASNDSRDLISIGTKG